MNVYILIEEAEQNEFVNKNGDSAEGISTIVGVYGDREKAEKEKAYLDALAKENEKKYSCDPLYYLIEERPVIHGEVDKER